MPDTTSTPTTKTRNKAAAKSSSLSSSSSLIAPTSDSPVTTTSSLGGGDHSESTMESSACHAEEEEEDYGVDHHHTKFSTQEQQREPDDSPRRRRRISKQQPTNSPADDEQSDEKRRRGTLFGRREKRRQRRRSSISISEYVEHAAGSSSASSTDSADVAFVLLLSHPYRAQSWSEILNAIHSIHYFWTSPLLLQIYAVLLAVIIVRQFWVLQVISILVLTRISRLVLAWAGFVWGAPDVKRLKSLILWWIKFGLNFASKTVEGRTLHKLVATINYHFWSGIGKDLTLGTIKNIATQNKQKVISKNREIIQKANENRQRIVSSFSSLPQMRN